MNDELREWENGVFLGIPIKQWPADLYYWEKFFLNYPISRMVELGGWLGGTSLFFLCHAKQRDFEFDTFDIIYPTAAVEPVGDALDLKSHFHLGNIFEENKSKVIDLLTNNRTTSLPILLYCDNGWKPREVETFAPFLQSGDYIVVHDWKTEIHPNSIPYDILEDMTDKLCEEGKSLTRWFIRR